MFKQLSRNGNYKYISYGTFASLFDWLQVINYEMIFDELDYKNKGRLNIFQLMTILAWTSFSNRTQKIQCIF